MQWLTKVAAQAQLQESLSSPCSGRPTSRRLGDASSFHLGDISNVKGQTGPLGSAQACSFSPPPQF